MRRERAERFHFSQKKLERKKKKKKKSKEKLEKIKGKP